jgi:biotin transport system substrate-specific component
MTIYASLLAALTAAGAYISIPIGPVPIVLQNLFVMLTGILLGPRWGTASISVYLLAGVCGLPVFAGGTGGIGRMVGPTGGYLMGFVPAVFITGWLSEKGRHRVIADIAAMICGAAVIYVCGVAWLLKVLPHMGLLKAFTVGMVPFLPGDALKIAAAVPIAKAVRPIIEASSTAKRPGVANPNVDIGRKDR